MVMMRMMWLGIKVMIRIIISWDYCQPRQDRAGPLLQLVHCHPAREPRPEHGAGDQQHFLICYFLIIFFLFFIFLSGDWQLQQRPAQSDHVLAHRSPEGQVRQRLDADDWSVLDDRCISLALCLCLELIPIE